MSEILKHFIADLSTNQQALKILGVGSARLAELQAEAELDTGRTWITASPANNAHRDLAARIGVVVSGYRDSGTISRPTSLRRVGSEVWVGSESARIVRFDSNWSLLGYLPMRWGNPSDPDMYYRVSDFAVDETARRVYVVMRYYYRVRAFDLDTGAHIWTLGDGTPGDIASGQVNQPISCDVLPNGNLAVAVFYGAGEASAGGNGYVVEVDGETGSVVATRLSNTAEGFPWQGAVHHPSRIRIMGGRLHISYWDISGGLIGVFDPSTWDYIESYTKPAGFDVQSINPAGMSLNDPDPAVATELVVCANGPKKLVALGLADHDYKWHVGEQTWDDRVSADNLPGQVGNVSDVIPLGGGLYAVADYQNNRITVVPQFGYVSVPYAVSLPSGYRIVADALPAGYDVASHTLTVPLSRIGEIGDIHLLCERACA